MARFMRKNEDTGGIYQRIIKEGRDEHGAPTVADKIKITGRGIYETKDKKLIKDLREDPELVEIEKGDEEEPKEE